MLAGQGNRPLRCGYRAACAAGAAYRFASHANPGEGQPGGSQEKGTPALVSAERKINYRNGTGFEGTTLEGTTLGSSAAAMLPPSPWRFFPGSYLYRASSLRGSLPSARAWGPVRSGRPLQRASPAKAPHVRGGNFESPHRSQWRTSGAALSPYRENFSQSTRTFRARYIRPACDHSSRSHRKSRSGAAAAYPRRSWRW